MADTPEGTGLSVNAAATLLTGDADTQTVSETHAPGAEVPGATGDDTPAEAPADAQDATTEEAAATEQAESVEEEPGQPAKIRVKNPDGTDTEVTLDELTKGYQRQADYTRKTQEVANQRKTLEQHFAAIQEARAQEIQVVQLAQQMLSAGLSQEPDWTRLASEDPLEYVQQRAAWDQRQQQLQSLITYQHQVSAQTQAAQAAEHGQRLAREQDSLVTQLPEWKNPDTAKAEKAKLREYGQKAGFTQPELMGLADHRQVVILRKAMLYDELMAKRPGIEAKGPPAPRTMQPGAGQGGGAKGTERARAHAQLAKTGSISDAAKALLA